MQTRKPKRQLNVRLERPTLAKLYRDARRNGKSVQSILGHICDRFYQQNDIEARRAMYVAIPNKTTGRSISASL
jgi:hypothetical protein